jgi:hypothetical protein
MGNRFPWDTVKGWKVSSLANGNLLIEPDYIHPYKGPEEGGGPGLFTRMALADWCLNRLCKRRVNSRDQPGREHE